MKTNMGPLANPPRQNHFLKWIAVATSATGLSLTALGQGLPATQFQYERLYSFGTQGLPSGSSVAGELIEGSDGRLYGVTPDGGSNSVGTIFVLEKDGTGYRILRSFANPLEEIVSWSMLATTPNKSRNWPCASMTPGFSNPFLPE